MNEVLARINDFDLQGVLLSASASDYALIAIFLSVLFLGEVAVFVSLVLAHQGIFSLEFVFFSALLATITADTAWFLIGRYFPKDLIPGFFRRVTLPPKVISSLKILKARAFLSILFFKFFIGTRLAIIIYLAQQPISFVRFFLYNFIGALVYIGVITAIAIVFGEVINAAFATYRLIMSLVLGTVFILFLTLYAKKVYTNFINSGDKF